MQAPQSMQRYFQQVRPLSACDAEDGRIVGRMLTDLVDRKRKPKDLAHAIRTFANNTAMLRESGFRHIGVMLVHLLMADAPGRAVNGAATAVLDPSSVTEQQAIAIGSAIASSVCQSHVPATALKRIVMSHPVLQAMTLGHAWFFPMLELLTAHRCPSVLQKRREDAEILKWVDDVKHDTAQRQNRVAALQSPQSYTSLEKEIIAKCIALFESFERNPNKRPYKHVPTISQAETA
jgi:hypothetical protein